jgi:hypothetical protein
MPLIMSHYKVLKDLKKPAKSQKAKARDMFLVLQMYKEVYELMIHFMSEFALKIAEKKKSQFRMCKLYFDEVMEERQGGTARKGRLVWFFEKQGYFRNGKCRLSPTHTIGIKRHMLTRFSMRVSRVLFSVETT